MLQGKHAHKQAPSGTRDMNRLSISILKSCLPMGTSAADCGSGDLSPFFEQLFQATARLYGALMRLPERDSNSGTRNVSSWPDPEATLAGRRVRRWETTGRGHNTPETGRLTRCGHF